jgi:hypothetical protein
LTPLGQRLGCTLDRSRFALKSSMLADGTSRYFAATRDLVGCVGKADIRLTAYTGPHDPHVSPHVARRTTSRGLACPRRRRGRCPHLRERQHAAAAGQMVLAERRGGHGVAARHPRQRAGAVAGRGEGSALSSGGQGDNGAAAHLVHDRWRDRSLRRPGPRGVRVRGSSTRPSCSPSISWNWMARTTVGDRSKCASKRWRG